DRNRSHWSTSKTPSYTKSVSWQHHPLRDKKRFDGEIFDLDISLDRVEGAALEFYEAAARRSIRQVFLDVAAGLCEGDEQSPEKRPVILEAQDVLITYRGKLPGIITGSLKSPPKW
ncbi:YdfR family protein, partial [Escherichia coli]